MGQCTQMERVDNAPGLIEFRCASEAVLWGHCEAHLTPRERAVWERFRRAIAAVREEK